MKGYVDCLKAEQKHLFRIISDVLRKAETDPQRAMRRHPRKPVSNNATGGLDVTNRDGSTRAFLVRPFDISLGGVGLLHGGYIHVGTIVSVIMPMGDGELLRMPGKVARCELIRNRIHLIGVQFERELDPRVLAEPDETDEGATRDPAFEAAMQDVTPAVRELLDICQTASTIDEVTPYADTFSTKFTEARTNLGEPSDPSEKAAAPEPAPAPAPAPTKAKA